jgi:hypothetical protein
VSSSRRVSTPDTVPVGPTLSMFDPVYLGIDEAGLPVYLPMMYNNLLVGGVPGSGNPWSCPSSWPTPPCPPTAAPT